VTHTKALRRVSGWTLQQIPQLMKQTQVEDIIVHPLYDHIPEYDEVF
jgi:hypothetical protein